MPYDIAGDSRLDPRIKAILAGLAMEPAGDVESREQLLAEANSEEAPAIPDCLRPAAAVVAAAWPLPCWMAAPEIAWPAAGAAAPFRAVAPTAVRIF